MMQGKELEDALARLLAAELIFRRGSSPGAVYTFKHPLIRDAAYSDLGVHDDRDTHYNHLRARVHYEQPEEQRCRSLLTWSPLTSRLARKGLLAVTWFVQQHEGARTWVQIANPGLEHLGHRAALDPAA